VFEFLTPEENEEEIEEFKKMALQAKGADPTSSCLKM
jgi:hypothetical protein